MKTSFLFPHSYKKWGWWLFGISLVGGTVMYFSGVNFDLLCTRQMFALVSDELLGSTQYATWVETGIADECILTLILVGGILVGFSRTLNEDEFIAKIRYESLVWAFYFNALMFVLCTWLVYGMSYFTVMIGNTFSTLLFFNLRFHYQLLQLNRRTHEE